MKKYFFFPLFFILIILSSGAQTLEKKWGFGAAAGTYYNDGLKTFGLDIDAYLSRYLSRSFDLMAKINLGYFGNQNINEPLDMFNPSLNLRYKLYNDYLLPIDSKFQPYITAGAGYLFDNAKSDVNFNAAIGVKYPVSKTFSFYAEAGYIYGINSLRERTDGSFGDVHDNFFKIVIGVETSFLRQPDSDGDGITDNIDECPDTPIGALVNLKGCPSDSDEDGVFDGIDQCAETPRGAPVDEFGCPLDSDKDGVIDLFDKCPDTPLRYKIDENGCPYDSDGDGVYDEDDKCPDTPAGIEVDKKGCPIDSDGDGVPDENDKCPDTPRGTDVDEKGCPVDTDGDGVTDKLDKCPDTPRKFKVDKDGCPDGTATIEMLNEKLYAIYFDTNKSNVTTEQNFKIDNLVDILNQYPEYHVNIYGHADPRGTDEYNKALSQRRINSVVSQLKAKGVDPKRIRTKAFGEELARQGELSEEELQENRKVASYMFILIEN
ncbi:MAG: OmpA family protein [Prolixibacteraceae bacterium]|nr:OmpA family protein [Prolixibacteraceae bacterium]